MQKGSVLPFIIFTIVLLGIAGFLYISKQSTKSFIKPVAIINSSKNYINNTLGFQFQYSGQDLTIKEDTEELFNKRGNGDFRKNFKGYVQYDPGKFIGAVVVLDKNNSFDTNPLTLWVFDNPKGLTIDEWYKNYWYFPFVWGDFTYQGKTVLAPKTEATISGQMAKSGIIDYQPGKPKFIYLSKDKKMYLFRIIGQSGDKILSTLKFI